jgi:hypothetical protein
MGLDNMEGEGEIKNYFNKNKGNRNWEIRNWNW